MANNSNQTADLFGSYPQMKKDETKEEIAERFKTPYDATLKDVKSVAEFTPIVGDAIALSQLPENAQEAFSLLKGGFETRDVIRLGKGAGLAALAALDLTAVGDVAKPLIKKAKDALRGTADALSPQAVTDTGIPVDIPDTTTNVTQPITQEKPKPLEMQVKARFGTQRFEGAIDKFKELKRVHSQDVERYKNIIGTNSANPIGKADIDYTYGVNNKILLKELGDITNLKTVDDSAIITDIETKKFLKKRAEDNIVEHLLKTEGSGTIDVPESEYYKYLSGNDIRDALERQRYYETGVYEGLDGILKTEIPTYNARLKTVGSASFAKDPEAAYRALSGEPVTLGKILDFKELYAPEAYGKARKVFSSKQDRTVFVSGKGEDVQSTEYQPIQNVRVKVYFEEDPNRRNGAYYDPIEDAIYIEEGALDDAGQFRSNLLHEVQHAIQRREGFDFGGNVREFLPAQYKNTLRADIPDSEWKKAVTEYQKLRGEIEARIVEDKDTMVDIDNTLRLSKEEIIEAGGDTIEEAIKKADKTFPLDAKDIEGRGRPRASTVFPEEIESAKRTRQTDSMLIDMLGDEGIGAEHPNIQEAVNKYVYDVDKSGIEMAVASPDYSAYKADLDNILKSRFPDGKIPVTRILNYASSPDGKKPKKIKTILDIEDIVFAGNEAERELIADLNGDLTSFSIEKVKKEMNKGGVTMKKQMNLFNEGGLEQDGGTVDPVSGNDVPVGSTQEEVRDDIPAQLSEGEFVFPADVVRFIGLEKLMAMRQKAKEGLSKMEAMGQMGNSEEATLPDDIPFDESDIIAEDDDGNEVEMAKGGVLMAQEGTVVPKKITTGFAQEQFVDPKTGETVSVYNVNGMYIPFDPRKRGFVKKGTEVKPQEPVQQQVQQPQPQQEEKEDDRSEYDGGVEITLGYEIDPDTNEKIPQKYTVKKDLLTGEVLIANEKMDKEAGFSSPQWIQLDDTLSQKLGFTAKEGGASKDDLMMTASFGSKGGPMGAGMATLSGKGDELNAEKADAQAKIKEFNALRANENLSDIYGQHLQNQQQKKDNFKFSDVFKRKDKPNEKPVYNTATVANQSNKSSNVSSTPKTFEQYKEDEKDIRVSDDSTITKINEPTEEEKKYDEDESNFGASDSFNKGGIATKPKKKKTMKKGGLASKK